MSLKSHISSEKSRCLGKNPTWLEESFRNTWHFDAFKHLVITNEVAGRWCFHRCLSVILFVGGVPCDHYPRCIGPHCTGPLVLNIRHGDPPNPVPSEPWPICQPWRQPQPPSEPWSTPQTSDMGPLIPMLVTSGGNHWRPVQTCSCEDAPPAVTSGGCSWSMYSFQVGGRNCMNCCFSNNLPCKSTEVCTQIEFLQCKSNL